MEHIKIWIQNHWIFLVMLPGNLLAFQALAMNTAEAHGYTKTASLLKKFGNFISFIADIVSGLLAKKTTTNPPTTGG
jgi:hypothetical protein